MINEKIFEKANKGDKSILKLPKERLMIKNNAGWTPVHYLAMDGVKEILDLDKELLTIKDKYGCTPVHYLAINGIKIPEEYKELI